MFQTARMHTGPEIGGCKPVLVTFEEFKDREDVLRKGGMLKGSTVSVTEDMSRWGNLLNPKYPSSQIKQESIFQTSERV